MKPGLGRSAAIAGTVLCILAGIGWLLRSSAPESERAEMSASSVQAEARARPARLDPVAPLPAPPAGGAARVPMAPPAASEVDEDSSGDVTDELTEDLEGMAADLQPLPDQDAIAAAWAQVDFDEVRRALPDNLYFELSAPTDDEEVIAARAAERARWNQEYGKVISGTGTEEEVLAYFDLRARLSADYVELTSYLLDHYGGVLDERDQGLLDLARRLHAARLQEIPVQVERALDRKRQQDEARAAWLADEAEFAGRGAAGD